MALAVVHVGTAVGVVDTVVSRRDVLATGLLDPVRHGGRPERGESVKARRVLLLPLVCCVRRVFSVLNVVLVQ